jgi:Periplasmic protease
MNNTDFKLTDEIKDQIFYKIWKLVDDTYVFFIEKEIDWLNIRQEFYLKINTVQTYKDFYQVINEMLLRLGDPHTQILFSPYDKNYIFPISLINICDDYYINKNLLTNSGLVNGMKIKKVDNISINDFVSKIYKKYQFKSESARKSAVLKEFSLQKTGTIKLTTENSDTIVTEDILNIDASLSLNTLNLKSANLGVKNYFTKNLDNDIIYFKIVNFKNENLLNDFSNVLSTSNSNKSLILDIRGNQGGLIEETISFTSLLLPENKLLGYKLKRKINGAYSEFDEPIKVEVVPKTNSNLNFKNIIILCDEFTTSSAEFIFLRALKKSSPYIKIIGTQTAGIVHGASIFTLFDGVRLSITTWKYMDKNFNLFEETGITPDIEVVNNVDFIRQNKDAQLDYAIKLCI